MYDGWMIRTDRGMHAAEKEDRAQVDDDDNDGKEAQGLAGYWTHPR